jgi:heme/copper-type cytochrome/quinol oxidase subunit 2
MLKIPSKIKEILFPDLFISLHIALFIILNYFSIYLGPLHIIFFLTIFVMLFQKQWYLVFPKDLSKKRKVIDIIYFVLILSPIFLIPASVFIGILSVSIFLNERQDVEINPQIVGLVSFAGISLAIAYCLVIASTILVPIWKCIKELYLDQRKTD